AFSSRTSGRSPPTSSTSTRAGTAWKRSGGAWTTARKRSGRRRRAADTLDLFPAPRRGRALVGVQDLLDAHAVFEVGAGDLLLVDGLQQVEHRMNEGVFVPDDVSRRQPPRHVGAGRLAEQARLPT